MLLLRVALIALIAVSNAAMAQEEIAEARPVGQAASTDTPKTKSLRPLTVATELSGETKITGTLVDTSALQMKTAFGEAQIPLSEIAGVRFASGDNSSTTVVMLNGDSITGATDLKFLTVETEWGTAKINGQSILSMLFVPGLKWESVGGLNGKRWSLVEASAQSMPNRSQNSASPFQASGGSRNNTGTSLSGSGSGNPSQVSGGSGFSSGITVSGSSPFPASNNPTTIRQ